MRRTGWMGPEACCPSHPAPVAQPLKEEMRRFEAFALLQQITRELHPFRALCWLCRGQPQYVGPVHVRAEPTGPAGGLGPRPDRSLFIPQACPECGRGREELLGPELEESHSW